MLGIVMNVLNQMKLCNMPKFDYEDKKVKLPVH